MKLDATVNDILHEIQYEIAEEENVEISIDELFAICNSQFVGGRIAVAKRLSFFFDYIGTFILKNKDAYIKSVKDVESLKGTIPDEEYQEIIRQKRIANRGKMKGSRLETIKDIVDLPENISTPNYLKAISEMVNQVVEDEA